MKQLSFFNHVNLLKLIDVLGNCSNLIQLSLPTARLDAKSLKDILQQVRHLQRLDVGWRYNKIKQLLELLIDTNLKELTIRLEETGYLYNAGRGSWMHYWLTKNFAPQKLNFVGSRFHLNQLYECTLWTFWVDFNSESPVGYTGQIKFYNNFNVPMNWSPPLPLFQLDFGQEGASPYVSASSVGLHSDLLLLTNYACDDKVVHKAAIKRSKYGEVKVDGDLINQGITNLEFVTEFVASFGGSLCSEQLKQLAIACPNLHRLGLGQNRNCLKSLQGLRAIADCCRSLRGLDISSIPVKEVEDQIILWEIVCDMKLTYLAVDFCIILPAIENKEKLIGLFQICKSLQGLELSRNCSDCYDGIQKGVSVLSYFPSLIHCITSISLSRSTTFSEVVNNCKKLRCLSCKCGLSDQDLSLVMPCQNLQQLHIELTSTSLPNAFMNTISAHGRLVHVVFSVPSVTIDGVTALIRNSPELMTFYCLVYDGIADNESVDVKQLYAGIEPEVLETALKQEFSQRKLFVRGSYMLKVFDIGDFGVEDDSLVNKSNTDMFSLWDVYYDRIN